MREALASAPPGIVLYQTLEIINPDASWIPRLTNQRKDKYLPLTAGGSPVLFSAAGFEITLPSSGENGTQEIDFSIQSVDRRVTEYISEIINSTETTRSIYREYLSTDTSAPQGTWNLVVYNFSATAQGATFSAKVVDFLNRAFPKSSESYNTSRFPTLGR